MKNRIVLLMLCMALAVPAWLSGKDKVKEKNEPKIFVEKFEDKNTGCVETYEYYKAADGRKVPHGKYRREWSLPKGDRSNWSGREQIIATFVDGRLNGTVIINCDKQKWKRKSVFTKGKGREIKLVPEETYTARNLRLAVRNDTLCEPFSFELGNLKYEATGKINAAGELQGKYTLYKKVDVENGKDAEETAHDWIVEEQYLCDPEYTYKDAIPNTTEIKLGYSAMSKGNMVRIKIPRLRLSITRL